MTIAKTNPDITIRGGLINVPAGHLAPPPIPHQPDTPRTKKVTKPREDHQPAAADPKGEPANVPTETSQSD